LLVHSHLHSKHFNIKWQAVNNGNSVLLHTKKHENDGTPSLARLIVVSVVSNNHPHLSEIGNWNETYTKTLLDIKQLFTLRRPTGFIDFEDDFDIAIKCLKDLQNCVAKGDFKQLYFLLKNICFSH